MAPDLVLNTTLFQEHNPLSTAWLGYNCCSQFSVLWQMVRIYLANDQSPCDISGSARPVNISGKNPVMLQSPISTAMKVNSRKRRLESSSEEEDDAVKEIKRLTNKVKGLEAFLASKSKESTKKEREQLKEERKQVEEGKNKLEKMKTKVEEDRVKVEEFNVKVEEEKIKLEMEKVKIEEERVKVEKMLKEQQRLVECPVCLTLPRENRAVPCCPQGHFLCSPCMDQLTRYASLLCCSFTF